MTDREKMAYLEDRLTNLGIRFEWLEMQMPLMQKKIEMLEARLTDEIQTSSNENSNEPQTERHLPDYSYEADLGRRIMEQTDCAWAAPDKPRTVPLYPMTEGEDDE